MKFQYIGTALAIALLASGCLATEQGTIEDFSDGESEQDSVLPPDEGELGGGDSNCNPMLIDFESLQAGAKVTQYASMGVSSISCTNGNPSHPNECITFDSSAPTGGDTDLGTPNETAGGAGVGSGGEVGQVGANTSALGNVLIIAENNVDADADGLVDNPDDEAAGGTFTVTFAQPTLVKSVRVLDIDTNEGGSVDVQVSGGGSMNFPLQKLGDNSVQDVALNVDATTSFTVTIPASGAVANIVYCAQQLGGGI